MYHIYHSCNLTTIAETVCRVVPDQWSRREKKISVDRIPSFFTFQFREDMNAYTGAALALLAL